MEEIYLNPIERKEFFLAKLGGQEVTPPDAVTRIERYLQDIIDGNASTIPPVTRIEYYLAKISGADVEVPDPATRTEYYLAKIAGMDVEQPDPITRLDYFLAQWVETGGGVLETVTGTAPITLTNAIAKAMVSLTQYGLCTQADTPTPSAPVDIVCNNGALTMVDDELPAGYNRVLGFSMKNNAYWEIPNFPMNGSDTLRFSFEATDACNVIGAYSGSASGNNYSLYVSPTGNYLRYKNGAYNSTVDFDTRYDVEITPTGSSGMKVDSTWTAQTFTTPTNFCIGTTSLTASSSKLKGNLYGNIEVVGRAKFIPCERLSDNVLGYYDMYSETFFEPAAGFDGSTSLGYDGSHYVLRTVGTPEVLKVGGKNLFYNDEAWAIGFYLVNDKVASSPANRTFIMRCTPNTTYYWKHCSLVGGIRAFTVDEDEVAVGVDGTWIKPNPVVGEINGVYSATTGATAKWLCVCFGRAQNSAAPIEDQWSDFMLSVSPLTEDTPYEPYREPQTASVQNLYQVGDYKDEEDIISGTVTRRVGVKVLDGTEADWLANSADGIWMLRLWDKRIGSAMALTSTHFTGTNAGTASMPDNSIKFYNSTAFNYNGTVFIKATAYSTLDDFKAYLAAQYAAGTPAIVIYPLATETTESVAGQSLSTVEGTNVVSVTAEVSPIELEAEYMAVAP